MLNQALARHRGHAARLFALLAVAVAGWLVVAGWHHGMTAPRIILALALCALAYGLARNDQEMLRLTGGMCVLAAIALPVTVFNPLAVGDYLAEGSQPPDFPGALAWMVPLELFLLAFAHVFGLKPADAGGKP